MGDTGAVCSSERANSANRSGDVLGVLTSNGFGEGAGGGRTGRGDGVGVFCALRAWSALRRYSDLGATATEPVLASAGRFRSGVVGGCVLLWPELREEGDDVDMFVEWK
jgi:hypothetical protein